MRQVQSWEKSLDSKYLECGSSDLTVLPSCILPYNLRLTKPSVSRTSETSTVISTPTPTQIGLMAQLNLLNLERKQEPLPKSKLEGMKSTAQTVSIAWPRKEGHASARLTKAENMKDYQKCKGNKL